MTLIDDPTRAARRTVSQLTRAMLRSILIRTSEVWREALNRKAADMARDEAYREAEKKTDEARRCSTLVSSRLFQLALGAGK